VIKWDVQLWGFGSLFWNSLMHCLAERPKKIKIIYFWTTFYFLEIFLKKFFWGASPGSAGCFKKPTQISNAGHPICPMREIHFCDHQRTEMKLSISVNEGNSMFFNFCKKKFRKFHFCKKKIQFLQEHSICSMESEITVVVFRIQWKIRIFLGPCHNFLSHCPTVLGRRLWVFKQRRIQVNELKIGNCATKIVVHLESCVIKCRTGIEMVTGHTKMPF
jgi:hypothetical protein